ncbi:ribosomal RNA processing protein 1 homolog B [Brachionichthys hirsutus]|uniref:ribosomal RNA processing protein 1 homolog B n=1 Tax=Brachionichthys hirsutus TaxID=412623 RepID=UPI003604C989
MLYLESFMQTFKREWTGIDRLRMDKFYQLVRFMFRQSFEMLKRKNWESSAVCRFLELLRVQLLQSGSEAPVGLQFHVLDVYMPELAAVGAAELTADQNLTFIEPFCKTAAKTKDLALFSTICSSVFSTIMDQAPLAVEDLIKELKAAEASDADSGQASEEEEEEDDEGPGGRSRKPDGGINGHERKEEEEEEEDNLPHLAPHDDDDDDGESVLQFDYGALADMLFQLSKQSSTPSKSRQKLYKIIRELRNLSKGIFPNDSFPEEVSTDEEDDMFCSRKMMKRKVEEDEGRPSFKKRKTKEASAPKKPKRDSEEVDGKKSAPSVKEEKRKKRRKKKKAGATKEAGAPTPNAISSEALLLSEAKEEPPVSGGTGEERETSGAEPGGPSGADAATSGKKKKRRRRRKRKSQTEGIVVESQASADVEDPPPERDATPTCEKPPSPAGVNGSAADSATPSGKKVKRRKNKADEDAKIEAVPEITSAGEEPSGDAAAAAVQPVKKKKGKPKEAAPEASPAADENGATPTMKTRKKNQEEAETAAEVVAMTTPAKKKQKRPSPKNKEGKGETEAQAVGSEAAALPTGDGEKPAKRKRKMKIPVAFEYEADELEAAPVSGVAGEAAADAGAPATPPSAATTRKRAETPGSDFITFQTNVAVPTPLFSKTKARPGSKKRRTPKSESKKVTFGLKNNKTAEFKKTDRSLLLSPDGSSRVPFDPRQKPKFGVLKAPPMLTSRKIKTPPRKAAPATPKTTPKRRPSAADFF